MVIIKFLVLKYARLKAIFPRVLLASGLFKNVLTINQLLFKIVKFH